MLSVLEFVKRLRVTITFLSTNEPHVEEKHFKLTLSPLN